MPLLALFSGGKLAVYGAIALAALGAWGVFQYRGLKIERLEATVAAREAEIKSVVQAANDNAVAAAKLTEDWKRADSLRAQRDREIADVSKRLAVARKAANAAPAGQCGPSERVLALSRVLQQSASAVDRQTTPDRARQSPAKPAR